MFINKIYFDCEFTGLNKQGELLSIGCVDSHDRTFYAEIIDFSEDLVEDWVRENVLSKMILKDSVKTQPNAMETFIKGTKEEVSKALNEWLQYYLRDEYECIQFVSDVCHYDFVHMIDLLSGHALKLHKNIVPYCIDLNENISRYYNAERYKAFDLNREELYCRFEGNSDLLENEESKHNALFDAKVIKEIFECLEKYNGKTEILNNGAKVISRNGEFVFADRGENCVSRYVIWSTNISGEAYWGHYYKDFYEADAFFKTKGTSLTNN